MPRMMWRGKGFMGLSGSSRNSLEGAWLLIKDFNDVCSPKEKRNFKFVASNAENFNNFISLAGLVWQVWHNLIWARGKSDHCPLLLSTVPHDFCHMPFKFFNSWFQFEGFLVYIMGLCHGFHFSGEPYLCVATKFRWLENHIIYRLKSNRSNQERNYNFMKRKIEELESIAEEHNGWASYVERDRLVNEKDEQTRYVL
ncbi:hypothetical protein HanIR_Chr09g0408531 [Helianthus annuus]|nr:hypothetical protein HanIR_Chr09g0408531 [Helianthus annuus]